MPKKNVKIFGDMVYTLENGKLSMSTIEKGRPASAPIPLPGVIQDFYIDRGRLIALSIQTQHGKQVPCQVPYLVIRGRPPYVLLNSKGYKNVSHDVDGYTVNVGSHKLPYQLLTCKQFTFFDGNLYFVTADKKLMVVLWDNDPSKVPMVLTIARDVIAMSASAQGVLLLTESGLKVIGEKVASEFPILKVEVNFNRREYPQLSDDMMKHLCLSVIARGKKYSNVYLSGNRIFCAMGGLVGEIKRHPKDPTTLDVDFSTESEMPYFISPSFYLRSSPGGLLVTHTDPKFPLPNWISLSGIENQHQFLTSFMRRPYRSDNFKMGKYRMIQGGDVCAIDIPVHNMSVSSDQKLGRSSQESILFAKIEMGDEVRRYLLSLGFEQALPAADAVVATDQATSLPSAEGEMYSSFDSCPSVFSSTSSSPVTAEQRVEATQAPSTSFASSLSVKPRSEDEWLTQYVLSILKKNTSVYQSLFKRCSSSVEITVKIDCIVKPVIPVDTNESTSSAPISKAAGSQSIYAKFSIFGDVPPLHHETKITEFCLPLPLKK